MVGTESQFRTFGYEVLAGPDDLNVEVRENSCVYQFDYSKVYWNSKLEKEHTRLLNLFEPREVVCDVMAGIGPFAVPAGKKGVFVWANDMNPDSYFYLKDSIERNKVGKSFISLDEYQLTGSRCRNTSGHSTKMAWYSYKGQQTRFSLHRPEVSARSSSRRLGRGIQPPRALRSRYEFRFPQPFRTSSSTFQLRQLRSCPATEDYTLDTRLSSLPIPTQNCRCSTCTASP